MVEENIMNNENGENINSFDKLIVRISKKSLQGGLTSEEFGNNFDDWRLQHHIPTRYVCAWKNYRELNRDTKFSDIISNDCNDKAEGKK